MSFLAELKRRNVLRAAGAYVALSWLIIQVTETLAPAFGLPDSVLRTVLIVLGVGFLPAVLAAWAFELTPDGLVRDEEVDRDSAAGKRLDRSFDRVLIVILGLAVGYFALDKFLLDSGRDGTEPPFGATSSDLASSPSGDSPPTLAVLPFTAIGTAESTDVFALGVHDDLLTRLAKLGGLRVLSRTSVMKYRDTTMNLRDVGAALGASAILEGGVQSSGDRIRINAQLIEAATDEHLWAETYDRELSTASIFEVQADIAQAIATALEATITPPAANEKLIPTDNLAAYRAFHEAMAMVNGLKGQRIASLEYEDALRKAIDLDPEFTRPIAELIGALSFNYFGGYKGDIQETERLLARLSDLAPDSAEYLMAQSYYSYYVLRDYDLAHEVVKRAEAKAPNDLRILVLKSWIERRQGDYESKLATERRKRELDPEAPRYIATMINTLVFLHRYEEAQRLAESHQQAHPMIEDMLIRLKLREHGDVNRTAKTLAASVANAPDAGRIRKVAETYIAARQYDEAIAWIERMPEEGRSALYSHLGLSSAHELLIQIHLLQGDKAEAQVLAARAREDYIALLADNPDVVPLGWQKFLGDALLASSDGDQDRARSLALQWLGKSTTDRAVRSSTFDRVCAFLGLAEAADEAVDCLRRGLKEPSSLAPFFDPLLPHYDGIRNTPVFQTFLADTRRDGFLI